MKQAVTSIDQGYADNAAMMSQYRSLVVQINERYEFWSRYVYSRALLNIAVKWATTDPVAKNAPEGAKRIVDEESEFLGPKLVKSVNQIRLYGLPQRDGSKGPVFQAGEGSRGTAVVIEALPGIVNSVNRRIDEIIAEKAKQLPPGDLSGFETYTTNVEALRQTNSTINRYLDIDVTVKPDDLNELARAIRELH